MRKVIILLVLVAAVVGGFFFGNIATSRSNISLNESALYPEDI